MQEASRAEEERRARGGEQRRRRRRRRGGRRRRRREEDLIWFGGGEAVCFGLQTLTSGLVAKARKAVPKFRPAGASGLIWPVMLTRGPEIIFFKQKFEPSNA